MKFPSHSSKESCAAFSKTFHLMITLHNFPMRCDHSRIVWAPECRSKFPNNAAFFYWFLRQSPVQMQEAQCEKSCSEDSGGARPPLSDVLHNSQTDYSFNETVVWRNLFPRPSQWTILCFQILSFENFRAPLLMIRLFLAWKQCTVLYRSAAILKKKKCVSVAYVVLILVISVIYSQSVASTFNPVSLFFVKQSWKKKKVAWITDILLL